MRKIVTNLLLVTVVFSSTALTYLAFKVQFRMLHIVSDSMKPTFERGDVILVRSIPTMDLKVDQIAVLPTTESNKVMVAHRIVAISRDTTGKYLVTTKGDANPIPDDKQKRITSQKVPVYLGVIPISKAPGLVDNSLKIAMVLGILTLILLGFILKEAITKEIQTRKAKKEERRRYATSQI